LKRFWQLKTQNEISARAESLEEMKLQKFMKYKCLSFMMRIFLEQRNEMLRVGSNGEDKLEIP
jgi:hypothetical protein